jgi:K+-sensing histidine kinase KdpD
MTPSEQRTVVLHDLRSRFAVIQACTQMLVDPARQLEEGQRKALLGLAQDNAVRLNCLIEELQA